jgi:gliding motility-associated-like protein
MLKKRYIDVVAGAILVFMTGGWLHAQPCDGSIFREDYSSNAGWTWSTITNQGGNITIAGGTANFNAVQDDGYCRIIKNIPVLPATWTAECSFTTSAGNSTGHSIMDFTSNSDDPISMDRSGNFAQTDNHVIGVIINGILNPNGNMNASTQPTTPNAEWYFYALTKKGTGVIKLSTGIPVPALNKPYYIRLQRISTTTGIISVFSDSLMTTPIPKSPQCFAIDDAIQDLSFLQQGAITFGNYARTLTAKIDKVRICPYTPSSISLTGDTLFCKGTPLTFTANSVNSAPQSMWEIIQCDNKGNLVANGYTWNSGWLNNPPGTYTFPAVDPPCNNYYRIKMSVKDGSNCLGNDEAIKIIHIICDGNFITTLNHSAISCYGENDGKATVTVDNINPPYTYKWFPTGGNNPTATGLTPGSYTISVTDKRGCISKSSVAIEQNPALIVATSKTNASCGTKNGSAIVIAAGGSGTYTYSWNSVPVQTTATAINLSPGSYSITVTDNKGCKKTDTVTIAKDGTLTVNFTNGNTCPDDSVLFKNLSTTGLPAYWSFGDNQISTITNPKHLYAQPGKYTVKLIMGDVNSCMDSISKTVTIYPRAVPVVSADTLSGCTPLNATFSNSSTPIEKYLWSFGDQTTSTLLTSSHEYINKGKKPVSYTVTLSMTSIYGCKSVLTLPNYITVYPTPSANFSSSPRSTDELVPTINFYNTSTGAVFFKWIFGDGDSSDVIDPVHKFTGEGTYNTCLVVANQNGCKDTACNNIIINPISSFYIPNAFTPNNDGSNDIFTGYGSNIASYHMDIYDRWGNPIFETDKLYEGWTGKVKGGSDIVQEDVYVYRIVLKYKSSKACTFTGTVTVVK